MVSELNTPESPSIKDKKSASNQYLQRKNQLNFSELVDEILNDKSSDSQLASPKQDNLLLKLNIKHNLNEKIAKQLPRPTDKRNMNRNQPIMSFS